VCVKGPNVFQGYLKDPERTAEAIDKDGWLHAGDIGKWLPSGTLTLIDRKKHIFKLAQGEYIAPKKIETVYSLSGPGVCSRRKLKGVSGGDSRAGSRLFAYLDQEKRD